MHLDQATLLRLREEAKKSLFFFARAIVGFSDLDPLIHKPVCDTIQDYEHNPRVTVELPRTWFKSSICSIAYPIWRAINNPNVRILIAQNIYTNATKKMQAIKGVFDKNALFRTLFFDVLPTKDCRWSTECLEVKRSMPHPEGTFEAVGVGTTATSRHYDVIIEDDTIAPKKDDLTGIVQQPTQMDIERAIGWHNLCHPMLLHPTKSQIVVVGTRWAERDLLGFIYSKFAEYVRIKKAACEKDGEAATLEEGGKPTWPDRFGADVLDAIARQEGPYMFASLYLGKPTAAINQVFKREWIEYFDRHPKRCFACTSVDLAAADKEESSDPDYNVILTTAVEPSSGRVFVLEYTRGRMSPGEVIEAIFGHYARHNPIKVRIEAIGYQRVVAGFLRQRQRKANVLFAVEEITGYRGSKEERIRGLQPYFANRLVAIRPGMVELEQELLAFPKGAHDDIVDALSMQKDFWTEMTEMKEAMKEDEAKDPFMGEVIIKELLERRDALNHYPYDGGNMDLRWLNEEVYSAAMRREMIERAEERRRLSVLV